MPRVTVQTLAEILRALRPHLGQPNFPHALYRALREHVSRRAAVAAEDLRFPDPPPQEAPRLVEAEVRVWWPDGHPPALEELLRTLIRAHATIGDLRGELLAIEDQSSRSARMLSVLAHEIKNPLFAVLGSLELLTQRGLEADVHKLIETAHASAQRMHALVNDSLQLVALEQEGVRLKAERLSLNGLLEELAGEVEPVALASGVHLRVVPLRGDAELLGDRRWLLQALLNLALNAVKYTPEGGRVVLRAVADGARVGLQVEDTGPGIAAGDLERIFEPFQRADTQKEGSGLGLAIVKRVVEAHGGEVRVESQAGRGSRFRVELPRLLPGRRGGAGLGLRVLVLTAVAGLILARFPLFPVPVEADTPQGRVALAQERTLPQGGTVRLGTARLRFDPGSRAQVSARRSLWGGALSAAVRLPAGGVAVRRDGAAPRLDLNLNRARLTPRGTDFLAQTGEVDRISLYDGRLDLAAPGFQGELAPGEGAVVSADGVEKRRLLAAPQVRLRTLDDGRLELRWLPVEGAVRYRITLLAGGVAVQVAEVDAAPWVYEPQRDRSLTVQVQALDDLGLAGAPSPARPYEERGSFYRGHRSFVAGDYAAAAKLLAQALEQDPTQPVAWLEYGLASLRLGKGAAAREALERALQLEPGYEARVLLPLAEALEAEGDLEGAAAYYRRARSRQELSREATLGLIRAYLKLGRYDAAETAACTWLAGRPDDADAAGLLRRALDGAGKAYAEPGCPLFQKPAPKPAPHPPQPRPEPKPEPEPPPPPPQQCNPFCN